MKLRILASLTALLAVATVSAKVDYAAMNTPERSALVERFVAGDTTLTPDQIDIVYYGAVFAPGYAALPRSYDTINALRAERRFDEMMPLCRKALADDPTNLTLLFRAFAGAYNTGDTAMKDNASERVNQLCDAIFRSGKGVDTSDPFEVVIDSDIEQFLINYLQVEQILDSAMLGPLTVAKVKLPGRDEPAYLYFRVYKPKG